MTQTRLPAIGPKPPAATRVAVAMSGGVDSSVVAGLLAEAGYDVFGLTLQLYDHGAAVRKPGACCAGADIRDARQVADRLGIPHYVIDAETRFRSAVMDDFADSYLRGETPVPCIRCNERVKFSDLADLARELGADALATGHYVQRHDGPEGPVLLRAADPARDQSYFLFTITRAQLAFVHFPLGGLPKAEVRAAAARLDLPVAAKPDSQDICFVPEGRYADLVARLRPGAATPGEIVHLDGRVLGRHEGIIHYTVGQRRGLGLASGEPLHVIALDAARARVIVGPRAALGTQDIRLHGLNWLGARALGSEPQDVLVRVRSTREPVPGQVFAEGDGGAHVRLAGMEEGVAAGQACVFYDAQTGQRVLGGGWIRSVPRLDTAAGRTLHPQALPAVP